MITAPPGSAQPLVDVVRQVNRALDMIDNPKKPTRLYSCAEADLPAAHLFTHCIVRLDTGKLVTSDGVTWALYDGGPL